ncbi:MAG: hypothetical protein WD712_00875 [Candidatus Spechtbacterales bacterium]
MKAKLSYSIRKHIRKEKSRIRREFSSVDERQEQIERLYKKFTRTESVKIEEESIKH